MASACSAQFCGRLDSAFTVLNHAAIQCNACVEQVVPSVPYDAGALLHHMSARHPVSSAHAAHMHGCACGYAQPAVAFMEPALHEQPPKACLLYFWGLIRCCGLDAECLKGCIAQWVGCCCCSHMTPLLQRS